MSGLIRFQTVMIISRRPKSHHNFSFPENKAKKDLIQLLVRRGYDSDPVKAWKDAQNKGKVRLQIKRFVSTYHMDP